MMCPAGGRTTHNVGASSQRKMANESVFLGGFQYHHLGISC